MANDLIVKNNRLIQAKYTLTKTQAKFIAYMTSKIEKDDVDFLTYVENLDDLLKILDIKRVNRIQLVKTLEELQSKRIIIQDDEIAFRSITLLSYFGIIHNKEEVEYSFDKRMKPYLLELKSNFTKLSLERILKFDSSFTIRMYEIIQQQMALNKQYKNRNLLEITYKLDELKEILTGEYTKGAIQIPKSYVRFSNFKQMVLEVARKELKEKGEYYFEYEQIKTGRSITAIKFTLFTNGDKIKADFKEKKKTHLINGKEKQLAKEQIKRIFENKAKKGEIIQDKLRYEQKLYQLYLSGELKYDKDLQAIKEQLDKDGLEKILKQFQTNK
jgi:plasmid replication initiation protein